MWLRRLLVGLLLWGGRASILRVSVTGGQASVNHIESFGFVGQSRYVLLTPPFRNAVPTMPGAIPTMLGAIPTML